MDKVSALNIRNIDDSFIGKYVECVINETIIKDALIVKYGNLYYLLQDYKEGSDPGLHTDWRNYGYTRSWTLSNGDLASRYIDVTITKIKNNAYMSPSFLKQIYLKH